LVFFVEGRKTGQVSTHIILKDLLRSWGPEPGDRRAFRPEPSEPQPSGLRPERRGRKRAERTACKPPERREPGSSSPDGSYAVRGSDVRVADGRKPVRKRPERRIPDGSYALRGSDARVVDGRKPVRKPEHRWPVRRFPDGSFARGRDARVAGGSSPARKPERRGPERRWWAERKEPERRKRPVRRNAGGSYAVRGSDARVADGRKPVRKRERRWPEHRWPEHKGQGRSIRRRPPFGWPTRPRQAPRRTMRCLTVVYDSF
jgi:hypothetical protein